MADTTQREADPERGRCSSRWWLSWVVSPGIETVELEHGMVIGRDPDCSVRIEGSGVSRRHVEIHRQGPLFALRDLGSTNGTFLNGKRIQHAPIAPGDVLRAGSHVGVLREAATLPRGFRSVAAGLLGGEELQSALSSVTRAASSNLSVVLTGATGTGKERVARGVHELSARSGPFHAINCAALPVHLAEAELFGHRKGAFTGAERAGLGHFRAADRGTLFLDEVTELPLSLQAKLLRVLEEHAVRPLGDVESVPIDVRIIAATQRPLTEFVEGQLFRDDLVARLAGLTVLLPPLHERRADIFPLFLGFLRAASGGRPPPVDTKLIEALCLYDWPGNVRELEQLARQMLAVHGAETTLTREVLSERFTRQSRASDLPNAPSVPNLDRREHDLHRLKQALKQTNGSVSAAAALVDISRQRAYRLLAAHGAGNGSLTDSALASDKGSDA